MIGIFKAEAAAKELKQLEHQLTASEVRKLILEKEESNHELQIENAIEVDSFMKERFTNQQLYNWMVSQISSVYFQSYQLAYDIAKKAEKAFCHELGLGRFQLHPVWLLGQP